MAKILVIEDEGPLLEEIVATLQFENYDVLGTATGQEGINLVKGEQPDLVICDVMMPGVNGYEVLKAIRDDSATAHTPFVFLTARVETVAREKGLSLGANAWLIKPFSTDELLAAIRTELDGNG
jgi:DNA-binding response OmpR family regulator